MFLNLNHGGLDSIAPASYHTTCAACGWKKAHQEIHD
jgi:hypothetical protein